MSLEAADFGAGFGVPESGCPIVAAGEQCGAVRGESYASDPTGYPTFMSLEVAYFGAGCSVPEPGYPIVGASEQCGAIRSEGNALDQPPVSLEAAYFSAG